MPSTMTGTEKVFNIHWQGKATFGHWVAVWLGQGKWAFPDSVFSGKREDSHRDVEKLGELLSGGEASSPVCGRQKTRVNVSNLIFIYSMPLGIL